MFVITIDSKLNTLHPKVEVILNKNGFEPLHSNVYMNKGVDGIRAVCNTMSELKNLEDFSKLINSIHALQVLEWSDFTDEFK